MKKKPLIALANRLLPNLAGFSIHGSTIIQLPLQETLRGFDLDISGWDKKAFYLTMFFMPLYVPIGHVHYTFGHRLRREGWSIDRPHLEEDMFEQMQKHVPYLSTLNAPQNVVRALEPYAQGTNHNCHEAYAYSLIRAGERTRAMAAINALLALQIDQAWERIVALRAESIKDQLEQGLDGATDLLAAWEKETIHKLGLDMFSGHRLISDETARRAR
jgi:hypothetical protein